MAITTIISPIDQLAATDQNPIDDGAGTLPTTAATLEEQSALIDQVHDLMLARYRRLEADEATAEEMAPVIVVIDEWDELHKSLAERPDGPPVLRPLERVWNHGRGPNRRGVFARVPYLASVPHPFRGGLRVSTSPARRPPGGLQGAPRPSPPGSRPTRRPCWGRSPRPA